MDRERPDQAGSELRVAVCIATHRRPEGLLGLLYALDAQELPAGVRMRAVVVDNDAAASARGVCREAAGHLSYPLHYAVEKRRGIPQARNRALAEGLSDDFVAFLDDDEVPEPGWLAALLRAQREHAADAVAGPCRPRFAEPPPAWVVAGGFFERPRFASGERLEVAFTHNVLVRSAALAGLGTLFDERLALCGGEDVELFRRFVRHRHRIVWADDAAVYDLVPAPRATLRWLLRRALRVGASGAWIARLHRPGLRTYLALLAHGLWCLLKAAGLLAAAGLRGRGAAARALHLACFGLGRIGGPFGLRVDAYRTTDGC